MTKDIKLIQAYEFDERFYQKTDEAGNVIYAPSVTYVLQDSYPTEYSLIKWIGDLGNEKAEVIRDQAADEGSFVHEMIKEILTGGRISSESISGRFKPKASLHVKRCLKSFLDWFEEYKPEIIDTEFIVWDVENRYAGTVDLKCKIGEELYVIDFKTSNSIHRSNFLQVCAYGEATDKQRKEVIIGGLKLAVLHLGNTTKKHYTFNVLSSENTSTYWTEFVYALNLFKSRNPNAKPTSETFPEWFELKRKDEKVEGN